MNIGIVYRIFYGNLNYIGSTINLKERIRHHISDYKFNKSCSSKEIICFDDYEVEVLAEIYYVENHFDINLRKLEREYMEQYKCVNKYKAILTQQEIKEYYKKYEKSDKRKEYKKEYEKSDKRKEYMEQYKNLNSDKYKEYKKKHEKSDKRKEYKKEYNKQYYLNNKLK